jgi:hypothetical protein
VGLVVIPVVPDVLNVLVFLQHVDELLHIVDVALFGEDACKYSTFSMACWFSPFYAILQLLSFLVYVLPYSEQT